MRHEPADRRDIATGGAPQELIDAVRDGMDPSEQGATDGESTILTNPSSQPDEIKKALKAMDLMKMLDGQVALGNKSNSKNLGEHKVSFSIHAALRETHR